MAEETTVEEEVVTPAVIEEETSVAEPVTICGNCNGSGMICAECGAGTTLE